MQIGEIARTVGLSEHTLRYYEKMGLLPQVDRDARGLRAYSASDLRWLELLVKLRRTRMPLRQMLRYAALVREGDATLAERLTLLGAHERKVKADIAEMNEALDAIHAKMALYRERMGGLSRTAAGRGR